MIYNNVLEAMGHTPMIRLNRMNSPENAEVLVKYEGLNVGGSIKTRTAFNMIEDAKKQGLIHEDTIIVEPTSGNQGIGLALIGAVQGYKTVIFMPDSVSEERRKLVRHYGAEVRLVHDAGMSVCGWPSRWKSRIQGCLCLSSLKIRPIRWCIGIIRPLRLWNRSAGRFTAFARG